MEKLTEELLSTLIGKTIYWQMPDGREGVCTFISITPFEIKTDTIRGSTFTREFVNKAVYKSFGTFLKI